LVRRRVGPETARYAPDTRNGAKAKGRSACLGWSRHSNPEYEEFKKVHLRARFSRNSENSKANRIENYERSRGIWTNLFGGSKKNSEENSEK
jgi:hypothetical protein